MKQIIIRTRNIALQILVGVLAVSSAHAVENELTLYGWLYDISGSAELAQRSVPFEADFDELAEDLEAAFMFRYEARGAQWGGGIDAALTRSESAVKGLDVDLKTTLIETYLIYDLSDSIDLLAGIRSNGYDFEVSSAVTPPATADGDLIDGFVGARMQTPISDSWAFNARLDVGAGDSDFVWNALIGASWAFNDSSSLRLAYRVLDYEYVNDNALINRDVDLRYEGPAIGISFSF